MAMVGLGAAERIYVVRECPSEYHLSLEESVTGLLDIFEVLPIVQAFK